MQRNQIFMLTAVLGAVLLVSAWWLTRSSAAAPVVVRQTTRAEAGAPASANQQTLADAQRHGTTPSRDPQDSPPSVREVELDRAKRDALRTEILRSLAEQPPRRPAVASPIEDEPRPPGTLKDRIGGREELAKFLNHDFMPLADECVEQARARVPELAGMVAIGLDTVADAELGGIVEAVEIRPNNEVDDSELLECLSQTALSMILPPPPESGREQFVITMPIEPE